MNSTTPMPSSDNTENAPLPETGILRVSGSGIEWSNDWTPTAVLRWKGEEIKELSIIRYKLQQLWISSAREEEWREVPFTD
jgi:hypothetical protein